MTTSSYVGVGAECFVDMTCLLPIEGFMVILIPEGGEARKTDRVAQGAGGGREEENRVYLSASSTLDSKVFTCKHATGSGRVCHSEGCSSTSLQPPPAHTWLVMFLCQCCMFSCSVQVSAYC